MGVKPISAMVSFEVYTVLRQVARENDIRLSELIRRCLEVGLKKIGGKSAQNQ